MRKIIKNFPIIFVPLCIFGSAIFYSFASSINTAISGEAWINSLEDFYYAGIAQTYLFILGFISLYTASKLISNQIQNLSRKIAYATAHIMLLIVGVLFGYPFDERLETTRLIVFAGVTENSCLSGKSAYPWIGNSKIKDYNYTQYCLTFFNRCDLVADVNMVGEQLTCYKKNGYKFENKKDCDILWSTNSKERCLQPFRMQESDISQCLQGGTYEKHYGTIEGGTFKHLGTCISGVLSVGYVIYGFGDEDQDLNIEYRCNKMDDIKRDACLSEVILKFNDRKLCELLSNNVQNLKSLCLRDIK